MEENKQIDGRSLRAEKLYKATHDLLYNFSALKDLPSICSFSSISSHDNKEHSLIAICLYNEIMGEVIAIAIPGLFIVGIIWLIIASNKRINNALSTASKTLGFTYIPSKNIFRKKRIFGELDGYNCEVEVLSLIHI